MNVDLIIRGGIVVDGSGGAPYEADVAIARGRITEIGKVRHRAAQEIDATGRVVTPGFIDGHTHLDAQFFFDSLGRSSCWHGVTSVVMGNCGFSLAPAFADCQDLVVRNLERAEDMPKEVLAQGVDWSWGTFRRYLEALDALPKALNVGAQLGHSALRVSVMGERAFADVADPADLELMSAELSDALAAGALGFTTSRSAAHETPEGVPVASRVAAWSEVCELVGELSRHGGVFQIAGEAREPQADPELRIAYFNRLGELARWAQVPVAIPVLGSPEGMAALRFLDASAADGADVFGLTHCRGIGGLWSFQTKLPFDDLDEWREFRALALVEQQALLLSQPALRQRLLESARSRRPLLDDDNIWLLADESPPQSLSDLARETRTDPIEAMLDASISADLKAFFAFTFWPFDQAATLRTLQHPNTTMTFTDSGAHVSEMCDASLPTHLLSHWVRDLQAIELPSAIRMMTSVPARKWNLVSRGLVRENYIADLNVIDVDSVGVRLPEVVRDLPGGALRIVQPARGIEATIVDGTVTFANGEHTGLLPGRLLRSEGAR